ncbi:hypothetical protein VTN49DRAFT_2990 [Thermomyces lanuginosus]|uniref:uncharacterized protein n=1 Tax=Thermomyces lanuginosus TaxID=5541 RepID=UPI003742CC4A
MYYCEYYKPQLGAPARHNISFPRRLNFDPIIGRWCGSGELRASFNLAGRLKFVVSHGKQLDLGRGRDLGQD